MTEVTHDSWLLGARIHPGPATSGRRMPGRTAGALDLGDALVIVHPLLAPVLERNIAEVMAPAIWRTITRSSLYSNSELRLCDLSAAAWRQLLHEIGDDEQRLRHMFSAGSGPAIHFGMAPISVALELGRRLGPTHRVLAYYEGPRAASDD